MHKCDVLHYSKKIGQKIVKKRDQKETSLRNHKINKNIYKVSQEKMNI